MPNVTTKIKRAALSLGEHGGGAFRRALKTTIISLMDVRANRQLWWQVPLLTRLSNRFLGADFRMQALPNLSTSGPMASSW